MAMHFDLYLISFSFLLFSVGFVGVTLNRKHAIVMLMAAEIMFLAVALSFIGYSSFYNDFHGQVFALYILCAAGAESAIALSLILVFYRSAGSISVMQMRKLRG